jgi:hypothetical protein
LAEEGIQENLFKAIESNNISMILDVSNKITDNLIKENGSKYLELKLLALTVCGRYKEAYECAVKHFEIFNNDFEAFAALGVLAPSRSDQIGYFLRSFEAILRVPLKDNTNQILLKCYLCLILDKNLNESITEREYKVLKKNSLMPILEYYESLNYSELILQIPLYYIIMLPIVENEENGNEWFE